MKLLTNAEFEAEVLRSPLPVLVDFFTAHCGPCQRLVPVLEEVEREAAGRWKIVKVDAGAEGELAVRFHVNSVPVLLVFRGGQCVGQRPGARNKQEVLAWLAEV